MKWSCSRGLSPTLGGCWLSVCGLTVTAVHLTQVFIHGSFCERSLVFACVCLLTWLPEPSSCARWSLSVRCAASPSARPPPCWETLSHRCSQSPLPGAAPHLSTSTVEKKNRNETKTPGKTKSKSCSQRQAEERKSESVRLKLLTFHQRGEQRDVGSFPPAGRQVEAQSV